MTTPVCLTVGAGKNRPQGRRTPLAPAPHVVAAIAATLDALPPTLESWWSGDEWADDYRKAEAWKSAAVAVADVDYHNEAGEHDAPPPAMAAALRGAAEGGSIPGNLYGATPRGARIVAAFDATVTDGALRDKAVLGLYHLLRNALADLDLLAHERDGKACGGFVVDDTADRARLFYAPRAIVNGVKREGSMIVLRTTPYAPEVLAESAPVEAPAPAPTPRASPPPLSRPQPIEPSTTIESAAAAYNRDHPLDLPKSSGTCPACGHNECFGQLANVSDRWACHSSNHGTDSGGCGVKGKKGGCWTGDALDLDAHAARLSRAALLRRDGYLAPHARPEAGPASDATAPRGELCTELGNARRIVAKYGRNLRYTAAHKWLVWDRKRWRPDDTGAAMRYAKAAARDIWDEVKAATGDERDQLAAWASKSQKRSVLEASLVLASTEPEIAARAEDFDTHPFLFNVADGTIDLKTGILREHRREDLLTKCSPVTYDPQATCPTWDAFLARVQPDVEVRAYLRRHAGYCLTGDTSDQSFDVHHGTGGNGKSTYNETTSSVLGEYARPASFATFIKKRDEGGADNDVAALAGARLVIAVEPPKGARLNVAVIKQLTGGDTITARFLYKEAFTIQPTFKIVLVANHRPKIEETGEAAWRRVHLVPWTVTIPSAEKDKQLKEKLRAELPGILRWAVEGCLAWHREGLNPPRAVLAATAEYQTEEDPVGMFVEERCVVGAAYKAKASDLLREYSLWARQNGEPECSPKTLGGRLRELGFTDTKSHGTKWWNGLGILEVQADDAPPDGDDGEDRTVRGESPYARAHVEEFPGARSNRPQGPPSVDDDLWNDGGRS